MRTGKEMQMNNVNKHETYIFKQKHKNDHFPEIIILLV